MLTSQVLLEVAAPGLEAAGHHQAEWARGVLQWARQALQPEPWLVAAEAARRACACVLSEARAGRRP